MRDLSAHYGLSIEPCARVWQLSPGEQQRVGILKAIIRGRDLLMMDGPTGMLTPREVTRKSTRNAWQSL